jgi:RNA polymerase sigma-70 factor (ECF subfamily)
VIATEGPGHSHCRTNVSWLRSMVTPASSTEEAAAPAVESVIAHHYPFIWRVLRGLGLSRADAEDAAQQVFMIATRKLHLIAPDRVRSYLYGTAVRVASNARRGISRRRETAGIPDDLMEDDGRGPEQIAEVQNARALLDELLSQLPEKQRRVLVLAEVEQLEIQEIAALERIPAGTAASRLRLARGRFRDLLAAAHQRNPFAREP